MRKVDISWPMAMTEMIRMIRCYTDQYVTFGTYSRISLTIR